MIVTVFFGSAMDEPLSSREPPVSPGGKWPLPGANVTSEGRYSVHPSEACAGDDRVFFHRPRGKIAQPESHLLLKGALRDG